MTQYASDEYLKDLKQVFEEMDNYINDEMTPENQEKTNNLYSILNNLKEGIIEEINNPDIVMAEKDNFKSSLSELNDRLERIRPHVTEEDFSEESVSEIETGGKRNKKRRSVRKKHSVKRRTKGRRNKRRTTKRRR
jgi:hypothetical protein